MRTLDDSTSLPNRILMIPLLNQLYDNKPSLTAPENQFDRVNSERFVLLTADCLRQL